MAKCKLKWQRRGDGGAISTNKRFVINPDPDGFYVVDLDTYDEPDNIPKTLAAAKAWACKRVR